MTVEEINRKKYMICCPLCDNKKCARGTASCEAEQWAKSKIETLKDQQEPHILDKVRAEVDAQEQWLAQAGYNAYNTQIAFNAIKHTIGALEK